MLINIDLYTCNGQFAKKLCQNQKSAADSGRYGQNHLVRHSERRKQKRQTEEELGRQHQGKDRPGARQVPEGSREQGKMEESGCEIICGATTTLAVKG